VTEVEDSGPLPLDQLIDTLAAQAKALGLHIDLSYKFHDPGRFGGVKDPKLIALAVGATAAVSRKAAAMPEDKFQVTVARALSAAAG
jgi:hypothetical protein